MRIKKIWIVLINVFVMCSLGPLIGSILYSIIGLDLTFMLSADIAGIPLIFYAYLTALPVLIPVSVLVNFIIFAYFKFRGYKSKLHIWMRDFAVGGSIIGILCQSLNFNYFVERHETWHLFQWIIVSGLTGIFMAMIVSLICYDLFIGWNSKSANENIN
jgi:hypothetical protein